MGKQRGGRRSSGTKRTGRRPSRAKRAPVDRQEVEWQFEAANLEAVGAWLEQHSTGTGLAVVPEGTEKITDTYFDTEDWRLYRAGYALRVRKEGAAAEATMKSLTRADGRAHDDPSAEGNVWRRREITEPLSDAKADTLLKATGPVGERLRALAGPREASPVFEIRTERRTFALRPEDAVRGPADGEGENDGTEVRIGEVTLDDTRIPLGDGEEPAALSRVEVEAGAGTAPTPDLRGFVDEMQFALGLRPTTISKYEAGLYASGLSPDGRPDLGPTEVSPSMTAGEVAFAVLRRQFAKMKAHEPGTRLGEDPEELHDMRVATRRMRAAIKLFEDALPERAVWLREELRFFAGVLGEVRDLDVQMEDFRARAEGDEENAEALQKILDLMRKRREGARGRMLEALDSGRYERFESSFAELLRRGPGAEEELSKEDGNDRSREGILAVAPDLLSGVRRKWRKAARRLVETPETGSPKDYHDLRKKGKRFRYALEFLSDVYGEATTPPVKSLKALQDDLGRHQDAAVSAGFLREIGTSTDGPRIPRATAFAAGILAERYAREAAGIRAELPDSRPFRELRKGKAWKDLEAAMEKGRERAEESEAGAEATKRNAG